jgi:hypothetical protein
MRITVPASAWSRESRRGITEEVSLCRDKARGSPPPLRGCSAKALVGNTVEVAGLCTVGWVTGWAAGS